jgi:hypothetical protein
VAYAPDSSYFVVVTTGATGTGFPDPCDSATRWANNETAGSSPVWTEYSGGDSYYSVEVTGAAVYVGGHQRWSNNTFGHDSLGPFGVETPGMAALDPTNGLPLLAWNPGRARGRAVWQILATTDGLYIASDTDRIAGGLYRARIAFFPLAGGAAVPQPARQALPVGLHNFIPSDDSVVRRSFDGTTVGAPTTVTTIPALGDVEAATWVNGVLYTAHDNGTLRARSFDGTTFGPAVNIDVSSSAAFTSDLGQMTSLVYDAGRIYYTIETSSSLYMRYFSTASNVVGAQRFVIANVNGDGYDDFDNMVLVGNFAYYGDDNTNTLRRAAWLPGGGINFATRVDISSADADGISWITSTLWSMP